MYTHQINKHQIAVGKSLRTESTVDKCTVTVGNSSIPPRVTDKISRNENHQRGEERKDTIEWLDSIICFIKHSHTFFFPVLKEHS